MLQMRNLMLDVLKLWILLGLLDRLIKCHMEKINFFPPWRYILI